MDRRTKALQIAEEIANLRRKTRELELDFNRLVPSDELGAGQGESMPSRILRMLEESPDKEFDVKGIYRALGEHVNITTLRTNLVRLHRKGKIRKARPGTYAAKKEDKMERP